MEIEYSRKLNQTGNSITVSIPAEIVKTLGMQKGEEVVVVFDPPSNEFTIKKKPSLPVNVRPEIISALDRVMTRYEKPLKNLRDR